MNYLYIKPAVINKSMLNNADLIRQFLEMYITQCPVDFDKLAESVAVQDRAEISDAAHHIKPTMEYVGASELRLDFQEIESLATETNNADAIREKFDLLEVKFNGFIQELIDYRNSLD